MNSHAEVSDIKYPSPEEKCLSEVEKATKQISGPEDGAMDVEPNFTEHEMSKGRKCFESVGPAAQSASESEQQQSAWHCSAQGDGPFFIAIDASTAAAIKCGAQYTLVPLEGEKTKASADSKFGDENADPNKSSQPGSGDATKTVRLQMPASTQLSPALNFPHVLKPELDDIIKTAEHCPESEYSGDSNGGNKVSTEEKCNQYPTVPLLAPMVPNASTKESNSEREKENAFTPCSGQGTGFPAFGDEYKELTYTPLIPKVSKIKHEPGIQSCVNFSTPRSTYVQQSCDSGAHFPTAPQGNHPSQPRMIYTTGGVPNSPNVLRRPHPYQGGKLPLSRSYHMRTPWTACIPQPSAAQSSQMIFPAPLNVSPVSSSPSPGAVSNASGVTLNSSGEEVRQDSSPEFPRVPYNTPASGEIDVPTPQRVAFGPDGHQLAQYIRDVDNNMRYYVPFSVREDHNQKERERRSRIKASCQKLRSLIPGLNDKTDKATVFEYAASYLEFLKERVETRFDKEFLENKFSYQ